MKSKTWRIVFTVFWILLGGFICYAAIEDFNEPIVEPAGIETQEQTFYRVTCQKCGQEWGSSSPGNPEDCYHCEETFCDVGLMKVAAMAMMQPNGPPTDPEVIAKLGELDAEMNEHLKSCEQCKSEIRKSRPFFDFSDEELQKMASHKDRAMMGLSAVAQERGLREDRRCANLELEYRKAIEKE